LLGILRTDDLKIEVYDWDRFGADDGLGHTQINLSAVGPVAKVFSVPLVGDTGPFEKNKGVLNIELQFETKETEQPKKNCNLITST